MWEELSWDIGELFQPPYELPIEGLTKVRARKFRDPHKDADAYIEADDATRERMRSEFEEKLARRVRELGKVPLGRTSATQRWRERYPERYRESAKRWNASWKERHPEQFRVMRQRQNAIQGHKRRMKNLAKHIEGWRETAKLIVLGRDLDAGEWQETLMYPGSPEELSARTDFMFFLRHRGMSTRGIAKMLGVELSTVKDSLATRSNDIADRARRPRPSSP